MTSSKIYKIIQWRFNFALIRAVQFRNACFNQIKSDRNILIFGSGRSGTTWLAEIISKIAGVSLIDEPLKFSSSHHIKKIGLSGWGQFVPVGYNNWIDLNNLFENILLGTWFNPNHIQNQSIKAVWKSSFFVIKFIRANLLLPWLIERHFLRKPIFLIRNPLSVISSQLKHPGWGLNKKLKLDKAYSIPEFTFYNEFYSRYNQEHEKARYLDELLAIHWKMENEYIITHPNHNEEWIEIQYENILARPNEILTKICNDIDLPDARINEFSVRKPSSSTINVRNQLSPNLKWKEHLNSNQIERIYLVLRDSPLIKYFPEI